MALAASFWWTDGRARLMDAGKVDVGTGLCPEAALVNACYATEVAFFRAHPHDCSGTTAVCAMLECESKRLWVSNLGDSRALVVRKKGDIVELTVDQDAANKKEAKRIKAAGGTVDEEGYINGTVQTARSIGDADAKFEDRYPDDDGGADDDDDGDDDDDDDDEYDPRRNKKHSAAVVPTPVISTITLADDDVAVVLGCDGLFEAFEG